MRLIVSILLTAAAVFTLNAAEEVLRADRWGFDPADSTAQLQKALDSGAKKIIIPKMKSPWIAAKQLRLPGNCEIVFEDGAEILAKEGKFQNRVEMLLLGRGISGLKIRGKGILTMRRADYRDPKKYSRGEWRHTLGFQNCRSIEVRDLTCRESGGDGIYILHTDDILIDNVKCVRNLRQGISVISSRNLVIRNSLFAETEGMAPMAGIDFEPNYRNEKLENCLVENCRFVDNAGAGICIAINNLRADSAPPIGLTVRNCVFSGNKWSLYFNTTDVKGEMRFDHCKFLAPTLESMRITAWNADGCYLIFKDSEVEHRGKCHPFELYPGNAEGPLGNIHFSNVTVKDSQPGREPFKYYGMELFPLLRVTGEIEADGKKYPLAALTAESAGKKLPVLKTVPVKDLVPVSTAKQIAPGKAVLRTRGRMEYIQYAEAGETVTITVQAAAGGKEAAPGRYTVYDPAGKKCGEGTFRSAGRQQFRFTAKSTGLHRLKMIVPIGFVTSDRPGGGLFAGGRLPVNAIGGRMYFFVPRQVEEVVVRVTGDSAKETADAELLDPDGTVVAKVRKVFLSQLLRCKRKVLRDEIWSIRSRGVDDYNLTLFGGIPPVLSDSPENTLRPANK